MSCWRPIIWTIALVLLGIEATPAQAAWCNVFQVCWHKNRRQTSYYYAPVVAQAAPSACCTPPPPQQCCQTNYVQRSYYQPVTTYQTKNYYEQVTNYQTSYYYEPVTSYRYSMYYDPSTCSYQQQACPTTSYQLRQQTCPVQSWVQRSVTVPVTTNQVAFYYEPVTTCTTAAAPTTACCGNSATTAMASPGVTVRPAQSDWVPSGPAVSTSPSSLTADPRYSNGAAVTENPQSNTNSGLRYDRYYAPETSPPPTGNLQRQSTPVSPRSAPARIKLDRIAVAPQGKVEGQVVQDTNAPLAGAKLLFVHADRKEARQQAAADASGQFKVTLASGQWLVYVQNKDGMPSYTRKIDVANQPATPLNLVSR